MTRDIRDEEETILLKNIFQNNFFLFKSLK